jgi:hypothetical protein
MKMGEIKGRTFDLLTLGQLLLRLSPPDNDRLSRGDTFVKQASVDSQLRKFGLDKASIVSEVNHAEENPA